MTSSIDFRPSVGTGYICQEQAARFSAASMARAVFDLEKQANGQPKSAFLFKVYPSNPGGGDQVTYHGFVKVND